MKLLQINKQTVNSVNIELASETVKVSTDKPFIQANTEECTLEALNNSHIIPVFIKDNEPLISHSEFIEVAMQAAADIYKGGVVLKPNIRVSHPIKGRIPEAKNKAANDLKEHEKTLYYERMAFIIEIPSIKEVIGDNELSLTIGGIKAFNTDNLYSRKGQGEHFKIFVGFKNTVCTNLKIWSDGYTSDLKVSSIEQLESSIQELLARHDANSQINSMKRLNDFELTEQQFAHLVGRCRMHQHLPKEFQKDIPQLLFGDNQINAIVKDYYKDESFCRSHDGNINLWKLYNLFTGVNKSSYIDNFIDKSVNAYQFTDEIKKALENKAHNWYLN